VAAGAALEHELPPQDIATIVSDLSLLCHGRDLLHGEIPPHKVTGLAERGRKTRVITTPSAGFSLLGHVVRKRLLAGLRRDPSARSTLVGIKDEDLVAFFQGASSDCVVSTDLKRATDLLPLDLVRAVVDGLAVSGKLPAWEVTVLEALTGPQEVSYPDGTVLLSTRGILMGLPTSWAILSLVHLFWWSEAVARVAGNRRVRLKDAFAANKFCTCGDDGLAACWREVAREYSVLVEASGGSMSEGKHFEVVGNPSPRAVFIERLYQFRTESGRIVDGSRHGSIPLRGLVRPEMVQELRGNGPAVRMSPALRLLLSVDSIWRSHPAGAAALRCYLAPRGWLRGYGESLGLVDGLPLALGGTGLPTAGQLNDRQKRRRYIALTREGEGVSMPSLLRGVLDPTWQLAVSVAEDSFRIGLENRTFLRLPEGATPENGQGQVIWVKGEGSWGDVVQSGVERLYDDMALMLYSPMRKPPALRERQLRRAIKRHFRGSPPVGADLDNPPRPSLDVLWAARTRGPSGSLLYPQWAGETLASEATARASAAERLARFTRAFA